MTFDKLMESRFTPEQRRGIEEAAKKKIRTIRAERTMFFYYTTDNQPGEGHLIETLEDAQKFHAEYLKTVDCDEPGCETDAGCVCRTGWEQGCVRTIRGQPTRISTDTWYCEDGYHRIREMVVTKP